MEPVIMPGDVVLVEKVDSHSVRTGDIIMFDNGEGVYITHRLIEIIEDDNGRQFVTKGDNNASKDTNPSNESQFRGKIISIVPKIGLPSLFIRGGGEAPIT
jgi:signal peptidase